MRYSAEIQPPYLFHQITPERKDTDVIEVPDEDEVN